MGHPVKLYAYDLSGGMARTMSRQLTGIQIDGIWYVDPYYIKLFSLPKCQQRHSSVVAFGKEIYYGQGVYICAPGTSHVSGPTHLGRTQVVDFWPFE